MCYIKFLLFTSNLWYVLVLWAFDFCLLSQLHFEASVRMRLTFPKVGTWSPSGLPQLQSLIAEVKTPCLEVFFIPLKRP